MHDISNYLYIIFSSTLMMAFNISTIICARWIFDYLNILHSIDIKLKFLRFAPNFTGFILLVVIAFGVLNCGIMFMILLLYCNNFQLGANEFAFKLFPTIQLSLIISIYSILMFLVYVRYRNLNQAFQHYFRDVQKINGYVTDELKLIEIFTEMHGSLSEAVQLVNWSFSIHVSKNFMVVSYLNGIF